MKYQLFSSVRGRPQTGCEDFCYSLLRVVEIALIVSKAFRACFYHRFSDFKIETFVKGRSSFRMTAALPAMQVGTSHKNQLDRPTCRVRQ